MQFDMSKGTIILSAFATGFLRVRLEARCNCRSMDDDMKVGRLMVDARQANDGTQQIDTMRQAKDIKLARDGLSPTHHPIDHDVGKGIASPSPRT